MNKVVKLICVLLIVAVVLSVLVACVPSEQQLTGYDIDLMNAVFELLEVDVTTSEIDWNSKVMEIKSNKIDVIWNGMTITDELKEELAISQPYLNNKQVAVVKVANKDNFATLADYSDAKIAVESGSAGETVAKSLADDNNNINALSKQTDSLMAVYSGTSDVAIMDSIMAGYTIVNSDMYKDSLTTVEIDNVDIEYYGIAYRFDSILKYKVDWALAQLYANGTMRSIATKYGLEGDIVAFESVTEPQYSDAQLAEWECYVKDGVVVGVTYFQPICYVVE